MHVNKIYLHVYIVYMKNIFKNIYKFEMLN